MKHRSTFFNDRNLSRIRSNAEGSKARETILEKVQKWDAMSMDEVWKLMYSSGLPRSHIVFSNGWCPACKEAVTMYDWIEDPFNRPWKSWCPRCGAGFPKNDFEKYYLSGLDEHREFKYELADKKLLYNEEAPDPDDPMHKFGVDDGNGYTEGEATWYFTATYILRGIWYKQICEGIEAFSRAYIVTGEKRYARKCGVLIDRIADLFPDFDFYEQGVMYGAKYSSRGYVSYWCDIVRQLQSFLFAYDAIFEMLRDDHEFISFVVKKSKKYKTANRKYTFGDIQKNIETRMFKEAAAEKWKIAANFPWTESYIIITKMVLSGWPEKREDMSGGVYNVIWWTVEEEIKQVIEKTIKANGLSGEKGFTGYSMIAMDELSRLLTHINLYDEKFIGNMIKLYPGILEGIRFYMNAWLVEAYYPGCGDGGGMSAHRGIPMQPGSVGDSILYSFESYLWKLYKSCGDVNILRYMYGSDNYVSDNLFEADLTLEAKPADIREEYLSIIREQGPEIEQHVFNAKEWKLLLLHSGKGQNKRSAFIDYDSGGVHGHNDGMNIGIYAKGMNFMPDLGTPPHHRSAGWSSKFYYWNRSAAAHNTVIVDRREHRDYCHFQRDVNGGQGLICESGKAVIAAEGSWVKAGGADSPYIIGDRAKRFERTLAIVDVSESDCYFVDLFRVQGGKEHTRLTRGFICDLVTNASGFGPYIPVNDPYGMCFIEDKNSGENTGYHTDDKFKFVRDAKIAGSVPECFRADFSYSGKYNKQLGWPEGSNFTLRYIDLTKDMDIITFTSFSDSYGLALAADKNLKVENNRFPEEMLPGVAVRRKTESDDTLESVFVGIFEGTDSNHCLRSAERLHAGEGYNSGAAAFLVETDLYTDLILAGDALNRGDICQKDWNIKTDALFCVLRRLSEGNYRLTMIDGSYFGINNAVLKNESAGYVFEAEFMA